MAKPISSHSLWLPGFDPEHPALLPAVPVAPPSEPTVALKAAVAASSPDPEPEAIAPQAPRPSWRSTIASKPQAVLARWPHLTDLQIPAGAVAKFDANLAALDVLADLEREDRPALDAERAALLRYTGWGGIPASFALDGSDPAWIARATQLQQRLDAEDYEAARASVNNSHYTELHVVQAIWQAIEGFGFRGGRILEPAAGIGHFIGAAPDAVVARSRFLAIELDRVSGRMLQALYGRHGVDVRIAPLEKTAIPAGWADLVIGNVPFGHYGVADFGNRPYAGFTVHNYFLGRALDVVRPGGLVCLITSSHTLEASDPKVRRYLASQAHLLGAIRLPQGTFARIASTQVQTDVLFLRRREGSEVPDETWVDKAQIPEVLRGEGCSPHQRINRWYVDHPEFCIGHIQNESNGYEEVPTAVFDGDLAAELPRRIALLPREAYAPATAEVVPLRPEPIPAERGARPGSYQLRNGQIHRVAHGALVPVHGQLNATARARIAGMCTIRDQARALLDAQLADEGEDALASRRRQLNGAYDRFVARYGCLSSRANALAFRKDPDYPLLLSLEHYDEDTGTARKAALFTQRTLAPVTEPSEVAEPTEALAASMQWRGRVDPAYMARLLGAPEAEVLDALSSAGHLFLDPEEEAWQPAEEYLSGNVRTKLQRAVLAGPGFERNVAALEAVQPEDLPPGSIEPRLGAVWIPAVEVERFIHEVLALEDCQVAYSAEAGAWSVAYPEWKARHSVLVTQEFGTPRQNALELIQCALNVQVPTVRDRDPVTDRYYVNSAETLAAREKLGRIKERFSEWVFADTQRREALCRLYNDTFNATRARVYDGAHLTLPGFSRCFELHGHQKGAIWRIVQSGNTGLFHAVGAGKTAVCVAASMELRRLGFVRKPCHVVPNHMLEQYTAEFVRAYPNASVLMASKDDLAGDKRRELVARIATGDWDAVVITHASFERIRLSSKFTQGFIRDVLRDIELSIRAEKSHDRGSRIVKQLEVMKKTWAVRLERLLAEEKKDDLLTWEQLGIDMLFVDEAHLHKNLYRITKMTRVAGLPLSNSERAFDLFLKTRYTMQLHGGRQRGVVFATATPVANTMAEIHTMMRYLQPNRLRELGLDQFDAWAATFGESVTALEIAPDGSGYRMHTRFARFINVPELMAIFGEVADIRTAEMLKLPVPRLRGNKPRIVACPASTAVKAFVATLVKRAEAVRNGEVTPQEDNMLAITTDGRKAALDLRLVSPGARYAEDGKVAACLREVVDIWTRTASARSAQMVFCDLSSPKGGRGFSVYDDLRQRLIDAGIPETDIAFIHDAHTDVQKARLFKAVREGRVRVLLGSTAKMGIGTNVQTRLVALHHLDAPWRPCDVEQREGRILRQGNGNEEVEIFRYVTEGSFDSYIWQTLETKARFVAQVMQGNRGVRSLEDVELATLSYAEVKALASGNPLVIEKAGVDAEVARLSTLYSVWRNQRYANQSEVGRLPLYIEAQEKRIERLAQDLAQRQPQSMDQFVVEVDGARVQGADAAGERLRATVKATWEELRRTRVSIERVVGRFGGLALGIRSTHVEDVPRLYLSGQCQYEAERYQTGPGLVSALLGALASVEKDHADAVALLASRRKRLADLTQELARPFEHDARLQALRERQAELLSALDLTKDEAGSAGLEASDVHNVA